jgi:outer membrane protein assembly factor BamD (BamD/ComL family)
VEEVKMNKPNVGRTKAGYSQPVRQWFERASGLHQKGQLKEAQQLYQKILSKEPGHADTLHQLGVMALQVG